MFYLRTLWTFVAVFLSVSISFGASSDQVSLKTEEGLLKDFDAIGGNKDLLENLKAFEESKTKFSLVQNRTVSRTQRSEFSLALEREAIGSPYLHTNSVSGSYYYHFNPKFSVSLNGKYYFNELTDEGESLLEQGEDRLSENPFIGLVPSLDYPKLSYSLGAQWYMIYGKINFFDQAILHFDIYALGDAGQFELRRGNQLFGSYGLGAGFWLSQRISARLEVKNVHYQAVFLESPEYIRSTVASMSLGYLF